jgi:MFS family permease
MLCGAQFLVVLDVTIVAIALPDIRRSLGFSPAGLQWVVSAYTLAFGGLLVVAGRAGDVLGQRRMFAAGLAGVGAASLACALAPTPGALIAARAVQGIGAAALTPAALALLTATFDEPAVGLVAVAAGATALIALTPAALAPAFLLMGGGLGIAAMASTASGTAALGEAEQGVAAGVLNAAAQVGTALGLAAVITLAAATDYRTGFAAAAAIAGAAALALIRSSPPSRRRPTTPRP